MAGILTRFSIRSWGSVLATALLCIVLASLPAGAASLLVRIDLSEQNMSVSSHQQTRHQWPVSTAREGYRTPVGTFKPVRLERMWYSTKYDNAPMPYAVFFYYGYAIHGTTDLANLGSPASHGCVRLHPANAKTLFDLIKRHGKSATTIIVQR